MKKQRLHGFTLIELLVVIAIVAILAAILFPVFTMVKERGNQAKCLNNLKQLSAAVTAYRVDFSGRMPSAGVWTGMNPPDWCGSNGTGVAIYPEKGSLFAYTRSLGIYKCSSDKGKIPPYAANNKGEYPLSYTMNYELFDVNCDQFPKRAAQCMLFIHESIKTINDGLYRPLTDDPSNSHYDGTTIAYLDGHAAWKKQSLLQAEEDSLAWTAQPKYR